MKYLNLISIIVGGTLLYLLSSSSTDTKVLSLNYYGLLGLTGLFALSLAGLVGYQLMRLRSNLRNKIFGARLTLRLAVFFTLIAVLPGVLVYVVSVNFLGKSIESWFDVRVEKALEGGLNLGRSGLDNSLKELNKKTQFIALLLAEKQAGQYQRALDQLIDVKEAQEAALFTAKGNVVAFSSSGSALLPEMPDGDLLRSTLDKGEYAVIDTLPKKGLTLRALVRVNSNTQAGGQYVLQFTQPVPKQIEADAETVQAVYRDYQELTLSRLGLKRLYAVTLTLSLLVVLLTAVSAAFFISERLGSSLEALAEGTRAVRKAILPANTRYKAAMSWAH